MESIDALKAISIILILSLAIIPGIIPLAWQSVFDLVLVVDGMRNWRGVYYDWAVTYLPRGRTDDNKCVVGYHEQYPDLEGHFALPQVLFIIGYILILIFDKVLCGHQHHHHHHHNHQEHSHNHDHSAHKCNHKHGQQEQNTQKRHVPFINGENSPSSERGLRDKKEIVLNGIETPKNGLLAGEDSDSRIQDKWVLGKIQIAKKQSEESLSPVHKLQQSTFQRSSIGSTSTGVNLVKKVKSAHKSHSNFCAGSVIIGALSVHSFFEGLALGVLPQEQQVLGLMTGIILHNWAESLSIGAALAQRDKERKHRIGNIILLLIYSIVSPIGISIGWALLKYSTPLVAIIASSLAGGTFLYIGASEVVSEDFQGHSKLWNKAFYYSLGAFLIITASSVTQNISHGHSH